MILLHGGIHLNRSLFGFQASLGTDYWTVRCFCWRRRVFFPSVLCPFSLLSFAFVHFLSIHFSAWSQHSAALMMMIIPKGAAQHALREGSWEGRIME